MNKMIPSICLLVLTSNLSAQQENWDTYMAHYEKGPGSTLVNMSIKKIAPDKNFPFLFSAGIKFTNCDSSGLPLSSEFTNLYSISDSVVTVVSLLIKNILAGSFTYQCQRRDYFYVPDTAGLRLQLTDFISNHFPGYTAVFDIKKDKDWKTYLDFLYPNEETIEYMKNEKVLMKLRDAGDKSEKARPVDHFLYFNTENDRNCFIQYAIQNHFKIESKTNEKDSRLPYKLQLSRTDKIDLPAISKITLELERQAKKCNGDYDGWETAVTR
jgi:uncharacterized protein (TIGR01619 family)